MRRLAELAREGESARGALWLLYSEGGVPLDTVANALGHPLGALVLEMLEEDDAARSCSYIPLTDPVLDPTESLDECELEGPATDARRRATMLGKRALALVDAGREEQWLFIRSVAELTTEDSALDIPPLLRRWGRRRGGRRARRVDRDSSTGGRGMIAAIADDWMLPEGTSSDRGRLPRTLSLVEEFDGIPMSLEEYLERERDADRKHEYAGGRAYAMAGASKTHVLIVQALVASLLPAARKRGCRVLSVDMKLQIDDGPGRDDEDLLYQDVAVAVPRAGEVIRRRG